MKLWSKTFVIPSNITICQRRISKQNVIIESLVSFFKIVYFECLDASVIMWDHKIKKYGVEDDVWNVAQHEEL